MPFCSRCGKKYDPDQECPECGSEGDGVTLSDTVDDSVEDSPLAASSPPTAPTPRSTVAAAVDAPSFGKVFLTRPVDALRDAWIGKELRLAALSIVWIALVLFLTSLITDVVQMFMYDTGIRGLLASFGRAFLAPVPTVTSLLVVSVVFAFLGRKAPSGEKSSYGRALTVFSAASIPYAVALTLYVPISIAQLFVQYSLVGEIFGYYSFVVLDPARIAAVILAVFAVRAATGSSDDRRFATAGIAAVVLQALTLAVVGFFVGMLIPYSG
jgi:hypothetical protein